MAIPVISTTTSVLGYRRGQPFEYQMQATNDPTEWSAEGLPTGMSIDNVGLITGIPTIAGVYLGKIIATNATGPSAPLNVAFGIEESSINDGLGIEVNVDLLTATVSVPGTAGTAGAPILFMKRRDIMFLDIGFIKNETLQELNVTSLILHLREFDGDASLVTTNGVIENVGPVDRPRYRIAVDLNAPELASVLDGYEGDYQTVFNALAEIEWKVTYSEPTAVLNDLVRSSQTFRVAVARDFVPNP